MSEQPRTLAEMRRCADQAVVVADQAGRIIEVNAPFERLFGWSAAEISGKMLTTIIPPDLRDAHNLGFSRFMMTRKPTVINHPIRVQAIARDGRVFEAEHLIVGEQVDGNWIFAARIRPL